jgi:hypothetical protein
MKLVEILARELGEWPEGFDDVGQATDGALHLPGEGPHVRHTVESYTRSDDWMTAIITREMWQAERERIAKEERKVKPNKDGWIRHRGGKCPVEAGTLVDYRMRDGDIDDHGEEPDRLRWEHVGCLTDIMAWRPHVATVNESLTVEQANQRAFDECVEKCASDDLCEREAPVANPLQWRDRILSIDTELKAEEARHCAAMEALDAERAELLAKLKAEGMALCERKQEADECDMSNPENWRAGDRVECLHDYGSQFSRGGLYILRADASDCHVMVREDDKGEPNGWGAKHFK